MPNQELARKAEVQRLASLPTTVPQGTGATDQNPDNTQLPADAPLPGATPLVNNNQELVVIYGGEGTAYTSGTGKAIAIGPGASTNSNTDKPLAGEASATATVESPAPRQAAAELGQKTPAPASSTQATTGSTEKTKPTVVTKPAGLENTLATVKPTPSAKQVRVREYWIQVISSPNRDRVEQVKKELATKGWSGRISVVPVNKTEYFRLRYGPFDQTDEAGKFLGYLKAVPGLESSFLVEEYPVKTVAP